MQGPSNPGEHLVAFTVLAILILSETGTSIYEDVRAVVANEVSNVLVEEVKTGMAFMVRLGVRKSSISPLVVEPVPERASKNETRTLSGRKKKYLNTIAKKIFICSSLGTKYDISPLHFFNFL